eukprot:gnl/TRDRNA2_/TRDRNA2_83092_c0_seq1.p1 gnl/TRDRNA2_/TRDRNA2_83092_c0~~gnl/TRDRNA2_/TRDRNA2_83092_c0_seq1.p1  ORF type:complete len:495 (-),score=64.62 gnl/TRDRNA2_/TRDRNA2_83092_c0_seq1:148-1632(-)
MTWDAARKLFHFTVKLGRKGRESFQILVGDDYAMRLYPDRNHGNPHEAHKLCGPDDKGHGKNWTVGRHPRDFGGKDEEFEIQLHFDKDEQIGVVTWQKRDAWKEQKRVTVTRVTAPRGPVMPWPERSSPLVIGPPTCSAVAAPKPASPRPRPSTPPSPCAGQLYGKAGGLMPGEQLAGGYIVSSVLGRGKGGGEIYLASNDSIADAAERQGAAKYPLSRTESRFFKALQGRSSPCLGVPKVLASGEHLDVPYIVLELLGPSLDKLFVELLAWPISIRWQVVRVIGRLLLRRLEDLHRCGYVHCDIQPRNVLLGRVGSDGNRGGPFLIDFDCSRPFPGGEPMKCFWGTVEFNSSHSAIGDKQERDPIDDLESLAWLLCHGLFGELPWFRLIQRTSWKGQARLDTCRDVGMMKERILDEGWEAFGCDFRHCSAMPTEFRAMLSLCDSRAGARCEDGLPDYRALLRLLGDEGRPPEEAERKDVEQFCGILDMYLPSK